jgi:3-methyladenine DNA glycosylase/8-oxoguanine DNA glycosylase
MELPLVGAGGETVDLWRTLVSHGFTSLPPMILDRHARAVEVTLPISGGRPRTVRVAPGRPGSAMIQILGGTDGIRVRTGVVAMVRHVLRLDEDLSQFYAMVEEDPALSWAARGAGRMVRSPTLFEDIVKTVCTTNCAWSATERMVRAIVAHLGDPAPGAPRSGWVGRAFPSPAAMAHAGMKFYRSVARAGYRGKYLLALARAAAGGDVDLEALGRAAPEALSDDDVAARLIALPGVGPYAAAQIMLLMGRYSRIIYDSWTRPTYARLTSGRAVKEATIRRRFGRYGRYAGLAFWLFLTQHWGTRDSAWPPEREAAPPERARDR